MADNCLLYSRVCIDCGECDMCDIEEGKHCDDCGKCIENAGEYRTVDIVAFYKEKDKKER